MPRHKTNARHGERSRPAGEMRLCPRFPVGTHYIVEGAVDSDGEFRIISRRLVLPDSAAQPMRMGERPRPRHRTVRSVGCFEASATRTSSRVH
jgi:hypothetical protein